MIYSQHLRDGIRDILVAQDTALYGKDLYGEPKLDKEGNMKSKTSHTLNPVPFIIYDNFTADKYSIKQGRADFGLSNVAATTVNMLGYDAPDMWDESMISLK